MYIIYIYINSYKTIINEIMTCFSRFYVANLESINHAFDNVESVARLVHAAKSLQMAVRTKAWNGGQAPCL